MKKCIFWYSFACVAVLCLGLVAASRGSSRVEAEPQHRYSTGFESVQVGQDGPSSLLATGIFVVDRPRPSDKGYVFTAKVSSYPDLVPLFEERIDSAVVPAGESREYPVAHRLALEPGSYSVTVSAEDPVLKDVDQDGKEIPFVYAGFTRQVDVLVR